jgi:DEAD/DEAH box helicase domain-containing protein
MPEAPWKLQTGIDTVVEQWLAKGAVRHQLVADRSLPGNKGSYGPIPERLHPSLHQALRRRGIEQLYQHQLEAIAASQAGEHVVLATPTASGKSLCFHLPVLDAMARDAGATAIYLYPTKALSRDQELSVRNLCSDAQLDIGATVYDGDTPGDARRAARQSARLILTNPDMLHSGILPQHAQWARVMQTLRYIVVDELHTYRGVFGSHVAHVLGRLQRIAQFHGASPQFICATATIGNPIDHAKRMCGLSSVHLVNRSTAEQGARRAFVYNPPVVNAELGIRASYVKSAVRLAADLIQARVRTIIFGQSRNNVEIMLKYLRDRFRDQPNLSESIVAYRGGYLPATRRRTENGLRSGKVLCVVATSALELGIDIGDLDAVICAGYPGSLAETWQRFGRAGRRGERSLAVLVTSSRPIDQYLAQHGETLFDGNIEQARVEPENTEILIQHLKCAAFELPFRSSENYAILDHAETQEALQYLTDNGVLHQRRGRFHWATDAFPANHVSLRSIGWDNFVIIDQDTGLTLAELDWHSTHTMLHEQAIYQHDGEQYQVELLDYENHKAYVRKVIPDYFTTAMTQVAVKVLEEELTRSLARAEIGWGEVSVTEKIVGYKKVKFHTHENAGYGEVMLPDIEMHTSGFWLSVPASLCQELGRARAIEGLRGLGAALELVASLALMCDPRDIGRSIGDGSPSQTSDEHAFAASCYLYDSVPCGVGLASRIYERAEALLLQAAQLINRCSCQLGCPSCVGATAVANQAELKAQSKASGTDPVSELEPEDAALAPAAAIQDRKAAALQLVMALGLASMASA